MCKNARGGFIQNTTMLDTALMPVSCGLGWKIVANSYNGILRGCVE